MWPWLIGLVGQCLKPKSEQCHQGRRHCNYGNSLGPEEHLSSNMLKGRHEAEYFCQRTLYHTTVRDRWRLKRPATLGEQTDHSSIKVTSELPDHTRWSYNGRLLGQVSIHSQQYKWVLDKVEMFNRDIWTMEHSWGVLEEGETRKEIWLSETDHFTYPSGRWYYFMKKWICTTTKNCPQVLKLYLRFFSLDILHICPKKYVLLKN